MGNTPVINCILNVSCGRKIHTQSAKKWLGRLSKEKVPILVCLTFGDKLYAEYMTEGGGHPRVSDVAKVIKSQVTVSYVTYTVITYKCIRVHDLC